MTDDPGLTPTSPLTVVLEPVLTTAVKARTEKPCAAPSSGGSNTANGALTAAASPGLVAVRV